MGFGYSMRIMARNTFVLQPLNPIGSDTLLSFILRQSMLVDSQSEHLHTIHHCCHVLESRKVTGVPREEFG